MNVEEFIKQEEEKILSNDSKESMTKQKKKTVKNTT